MEKHNPFSAYNVCSYFQGNQTEKTEIRVAYDDEYLYASGRFYDSSPSEIRINSLYRDRFSGDDGFAIYLDTFNDNENALLFAINPAGIRQDVIISGDAETSDNTSWNTYWDAATKVTDEGWFAEIRIPLSSLRFQEVDGKVVMGLTVTRYIARKNERVTFPSISPKYIFKKPSVAQDIVLRGIHSRNPLYVTPYILAGGSQTSKLNSQQTGYDFKKDFRKEIGLDAKYNITDNLTLDVTLNTDFAQVEVDDQQINLTRFSLFYPEKRQFFQERSSLFNFIVGDGNRLLHTRRIGLTDGGEPIRILGGTRLVGKVDDWEIGFLDMQTARNDANPSENFGVLRARRPVFNDFSYMGGMITSRINEHGKYNLAYGVDGVFRVVDDEYLTLKWSQSIDKDYIQTNGNRPFETGAGFVSWQRRSKTGLSYNLSLTRTGADYNPGVGFVQHSDYTYFSGSVIYNIYPGEEDILRRHLWANITLLRFRNSDGKMESVYFAPWWEFESKSGATGWIEPRIHHEDVPSAFKLSETTEVPAGYYRYYDIWLNFVMPEGELISTSADLVVGSFYDGWITNLTIQPTWHVSGNLELSATYDINFIKFPERYQSLTSHLFQLHIQSAFDLHASAQAYLQYNSVANIVGLYTSLRYNFSEGTDLWIVYNHNLNTDRFRREPALPQLGSNTLILKYTNAFTL